MPFLKKSNKKPSMNSGDKPQEQSLAVAYGTQRMSKKKKMASGGTVQSGSPDMNFAYGGEAVRATGNPGTPKRKPDDYREPESEYMGKDWSYGNPPARKPDDRRLPEDEYMASHFAEGGEVDSHYDSIADAIMRKKKYADGGMTGDDSRETPASLSPYDDDNYDAILKETYDTDQLSPQPTDSNEIGDEEEKDSENKHDMISEIRKRMKRG